LKFIDKEQSGLCTSLESKGKENYIRLEVDLREMVAFPLKNSYRHVPVNKNINLLKPVSVNH
jgi:hypothetical protein